MTKLRDDADDDGSARGEIENWGVEGGRRALIEADCSFLVACFTIQRRWKARRVTSYLSEMELLPWLGPRGVTGHSTLVVLNCHLSGGAGDGRTFTSNQTTALLNQILKRVLFRG